MKKIYVKPQIATVAMESMSIMAGSGESKQEVEIVGKDKEDYNGKFYAPKDYFNCWAADDEDTEDNL